MADFFRKGRTALWCIRVSPALRPGHRRAPHIFSLLLQGKKDGKQIVALLFSPRFHMFRIEVR